MAGLLVILGCAAAAVLVVVLFTVAICVCGAREDREVRAWFDGQAGR